MVSNSLRETVVFFEAPEISQSATSNPSKEVPDIKPIIVRIGFFANRYKDSIFGFIVKEFKNRTFLEQLY